MTKSKLLLAMLAAAPAAVLAAGPFDGTWKSDLSATHYSKKPNTFLVANGIYSCATCVPAVEVKADGSDQPVKGHDYYDTVAVTVVNDSSYHIVRKQSGKVMFDDTYTVSADGKALDFKMSDYSGTQPVNGEILLKRVAAAPAGAHAASGSWQYDKIKSMSDNGVTFMFAETADGLKMSTMTGQSYEAKFDGAEVLTQGDPGHTMVSLKKIGPNVIQETDKRGGKVVDVSTITISADGKTMTYSDHDVQHGRTDTFVLTKQ